MSRYILLLFATVGVLAGDHAVGQTIKSNGTTIFQAGFESDSAGAVPGAPSIGSWLEVNANDPGTIGVFGPASGGPGAAFGDNYLRVTRPDDPTNAFLRGGFSQPVNTGDRLEASVWVYHETDPPLDFGLFMGFESQDLSSFLWLATTGVAGAPGTYRPLARQAGAGNDLLDITMSPGEWQEWTLDWVVGSNQATFGIGGATQTRTVNAGPLSSPISEFRFAASNFPVTWYLDGPAIPEPGCLVLAVLGWTSLAAGRRRRI